MTEIAMRREGSHLVAVDQIAADEVALIPAGQDVLVTAKVPRNVKQHRLAWALAQIVSDSVEFLHDSEDAMIWMKIKARHVRLIQDPKSGQIAIVPKSIAFASLGQAAFSRILNRMIYVVCTDIIVGMEEGPLRKRLEEMTADNRK